MVTALEIQICDKEQKYFICYRISEFNICQIFFVSSICEKTVTFSQKYC